MKSAAYAVALFAFLLVAVAALAPASLVDLRLARMTAGQLRMADTTGTVWRGQGMLTDMRGSWRMPVAWRVPARALLGGRLVIELLPGDFIAAPRGRFEASGDAAVVTDFGASIPSRAAGAFLPAESPLTLGGTLTVQTAAFTWRGNGGDGQLALRWRDARVASPAGLFDLGAIELPLSARESGLTGPLASSGGDLRIRGTVAVQPDGVTVDAMLTAGPGAPPGIERALAALGTPDANGAVRVMWRSALR